MAEKRIAISGNEVVDIFSRRAGGATYEEIASHFPFSTATVADVLYRRRRADVPVPAEILEAATRSLKGPNKRRTTCPTPNVSMHTVLAQYTASVHEMNLQRKRCVQAGLDRAVLDVLADMILDAEANGISRDGTG